MRDKDKRVHARNFPKNKPAYVFKDERVKLSEVAEQEIKIAQELENS